MQIQIVSASHAPASCHHIFPARDFQPYLISLGKCIAFVHAGEGEVLLTSARCLQRLSVAVAAAWSGCHVNAQPCGGIHEQSRISRHRAGAECLLWHVLSSSALHCPLACPAGFEGEV